MNILFSQLLMPPKMQVNKKSIFHWTHQNHLYKWESSSTTWVSPTNPFTQASLSFQGWWLLHTHFTQTNNMNKASFKERNHIKLLTCITQNNKIFHKTTSTPYKIYNAMKKTPYQTYNAMKKYHGSCIATSLHAMANESCCRAPYPLPPNPKCL